MVEPLTDSDGLGTPLMQRIDVAEQDFRPDMIDAACKFMSTPKVRESSFDEQKNFLVRKGLTEAEIEEARRRVLNSQVTYASSAFNGGGTPATVVSSMHNTASSGSNFMGLLNAAVSIGCISYAGYRFVRSFVLPRFFNVLDPAEEEQRQLQNQINDLQNSMKFVMDSVVQTLRKVEEQQESLNRAMSMVSTKDSGSRDEMNQLQSDVSVIKSLLLTPTIQLNPPEHRIPAWQRRLLDGDHLSEQKACEKEPEAKGDVSEDEYTE